MPDKAVARRSRRRSRSLRAAVLTVVTTLLAALAAVILAPAPAMAADSAYVMAYFKESVSGAGNVNSVHLAVSSDALEWTPLNNNEAILTPTAGTRGIRDPFLFRLNDGTWVLAATDIPVGGNFWAPNPNIHIWTSPDLVNWSADRLLNINWPNPGSFTWAPSIYWDASRNQYAITYSTVPAGYTYSVIMVVYTSNFTNVTSPVVLFDGGPSGVIDSHVVTGVNGMNYLYYKSNSPSTLYGARSTSLNPGSFVRYTNGTGGGCIEAPTVVKSLTSSTWWLWGDTFCPNSVFLAWQGDIVAGTWTAVNQRNYTPPLNAKHNSIHPISATDRTNLLNRYGGTTQWNRIKSWTNPGSYVRHANGVGRVDAMPFDPYQDSQWRLVPGLADPAGVSFESVNQPGRYLRHSNYSMVLAANDNSAIFRADATFYRVAGLANSGWSSFRSYNFPTRYLRQQSNQLYIHEITTATERENATFRVGY
ncbi:MULTISPECIES: glycoside hydrolase family 43 protein [Micromonospora]|uniref:glycoside hydrolase family 43 protein n=1 Tax=Micromonospora TaxID=1873 RepID=UPI00098D6492|nr:MULTISPECIES: glycoside hydrolase family 43 protein [unclassified Micromonospora]MDI5941411.1 glycoside hydrolase family 43 protein [Micromonospora sp. DH15]